MAKPCLSKFFIGLGLSAKRRSRKAQKAVAHAARAPQLFGLY